MKKNNKIEMKTLSFAIALIVLAFPVNLFAQSTNESSSSYLSSISDAPTSALLTGMTPSTYVLPSGWEVVRTQNFETQSQSPSDEWWGGKVKDTIPHSGNRSLQGRVDKDAAATGWKLHQGVATKDELYISFYEYMEEQGRNNDEMWLMSIRKNWSPSGYQTERWQWLNNTGNWDKMFNILEGQLTFFCEGDKAGGISSKPFSTDAVWRSVGFGKWQQWEIYWKSNTPGANDGITQIYLDGVKITEVAGKSISGTLDMTGPAITVGGTTYTKIIWGPQPKPSTVCATNAGEISESINRPADFSQPCLCPEQCPPNGYVPIFHRYVDDIIILQRRGTTGNIDIEDNKAISVQLFPNPVSTVLNVSDYSGTQRQGTIEIYTLPGTKIYQTSGEVSFPHQVDVSSYASGVFFVKVVSGGKYFTRKVTKL